MDRKDFFHGQAVQQGDLDGAFDQVEKRFEDMHIDTGSHGVAKTPYRAGTTELYLLEADTPNMTVKVKPGAGYTRTGKRMNNDADQIVNCAVDVDSVSTIPSSGNQRYISVFALQDFTLGDARTDPINGGTVYFNKQVTTKFEVIAGTEAASNPPKPLTRQDAVLLADILLSDSTTQIVEGIIDRTRRELLELASTFLRPDYALKMPFLYGGAQTVPNNTWAFREALPLAWCKFDGSPGGNPSNPFTLKSSYNVSKVERFIAGVYRVFVNDDLFNSVNDCLALATHNNTGGVEVEDLLISPPGNSYVAVGCWAGDPPLGIEPTSVNVMIFGRPKIPQ